jgi:hypothetical protein
MQTQESARQQLQRQLRQQLQQAEQACFDIIRKNVSDLDYGCEQGTDLLSAVEFAMRHFDTDNLRKEIFYALVKSKRFDAAFYFSAESDVHEPENIASTIDDGEWEIARFSLDRCGLYEEVLECLSDIDEYDHDELVKTFGADLLADMKPPQTKK